MNLLAKMMHGDDVRPTRLHTEAGEYCGIEAMPDVFLATCTWLRYKATGRYSIQPWWVYQAIRDVDQALRPTDCVLEVGGGYSTLWLAQRCQAVCSIEEDAAWAEIVSDQARKLKLNNVEMISGNSRSLFAERSVSADWDVVVIDGPHDRLEIFHDLLASSKRPRVLIYDDTDKVQNRSAVKEKIPDYERKSYRGFKPQTIHACETSIFKRHLL